MCLSCTIAWLLFGLCQCPCSMLLWWMRKLQRGVVQYKTSHWLEFVLRSSSVRREAAACMQAEKKQTVGVKRWRWGMKTVAEAMLPMVTSTWRKKCAGQQQIQPTVQYAALLPFGIRFILYEPWWARRLNMFFDSPERERVSYYASTQWVSFLFQWIEVCQKLWNWISHAHRH